MNVLQLCKPWHLVALTTITLAVSQVALSHSRNAISKDLSDLRIERHTLLAETNRLQLELTSMTRPERLREFARQRLGMAPPSASQVLQP